jgi:sulfopyruvate decarboxylase alpha subunit
MANPITDEVGSGDSWSGDVYRVLSAADVRQIGYVPDGGLIGLLGLCEADARMRGILLSSEQEGIGLMAGAWLGGQRGCLMMQSSGVGNCINALSLVRTCKVPLLMLVTMRGEWGEANPWQVPMGQGCAAHLERAGVMVHRVEAAEAAGATVAAAATLVYEAGAAAAVLIAQRVVGAKSFED